MIYTINGRAVVDGTEFKEYDGKQYDVSSYEEAREVAYKLLCDIIKNDICATAIQMVEEDKGILSATNMNTSLVVARTFFFPLKEEDEFLDITDEPIGKQIDYLMAEALRLERAGAVTDEFVECMENVAMLAFDSDGSRI